MLEFIHNIYELIRHLWWVIFLGWWAFFAFRASRSPVEWKDFFIVPAAFTLIALAVASISLVRVYESNDANISTYTDSCESAHSTQEEISRCQDDEDNEARHFEQLAVKDEHGIAFWPSLFHVYGDTVSFVTIIELWTVLVAGIPFLTLKILYRKSSKIPPGTPSAT